MTHNSRIVFGGGCFWCTEAIFSQLRGIISATPGYAGGHTPNPTYNTVCAGHTGHAEVVRVEYDEKQLPLHDLLDVFFATHDPTTPNQQGADIGSQYRSIILTTNQTQHKTVKSYLAGLEHDKIYPRPIITTVEGLNQFYPAEISHQEFYRRNPDSMYCQVVINPKLQKLKQKFAQLIVT